MIKKVAGAVERRPYLVIICVFLISGFMTYGVTKLSTTTEFREFLPEDSPTVKTTVEFENNFGGTTERILLKAENVFNENTIRDILELENALQNEPELRDYITEVKSYVDYLGITENMLLLPEPQLRAYLYSLLTQPQVVSAVERLISNDQKATIINVSTASELPADERTKKTDTFIEFIIGFSENNENLTLGVTGDDILHNDIFGLMNRDNQILISAAAILVIVILFFIFRRLSDIGISVLTVALGALWALGAMAWLELKFTMIHVALIPLIFGLGIDYSIHMLNRYYEGLGNGMRTERAISTSIRTTGAAITLAAVTTIIGFSSFMISNFPAISTLGAFAALGIAFTFLLATIFLPAMLLLRDRRGKKVKKKLARRGERFDKLLSTTVVGIERHRKLIVTAAILMTAICAFSAYGISTTMSFESFLPADVPSMATMNEIEEQFGGQSVIIVLAKGDINSPQGLQVMFDLENSVLSEGDNLITDSMSLANIVSQITGGIPSSKDEVEAVINNIDPTQLKKLSSGDTAAIYFYVNSKTDQDMTEATRIIRGHVKENMNNYLNLNIDGEPAVGGEPVIISDIVNGISSNMIRTTILAFLLCLIVLIIVFRSPILGGIALLPMLLTVSWEFGTLRALGWSLDVLTMSISALIIGIGIDYAIHVIHRFREERGQHKLELQSAIRTTMMKVGTALLAAAATTIGVFGVLALSTMPAIMKFGTLTAIVIFYAFVAALVILPSILVIYSLWKRKK